MLCPCAANPNPRCPQSATTKRNPPTVKFGSSTRDQDAKVFISAEHEKGAYGTQRWVGAGRMVGTRLGDAAA